MSVIEIKAACEGVLNASPMDYEAACEVWTRVCTPQAVLAALPMTCETCRYWEPAPGHRLGECRSNRGLWYRTDFCSDHTPKED